MRVLHFSPEYGLRAQRKTDLTSEDLSSLALEGRRATITWVATYAMVAGVTLVIPLRAPFPARVEREHSSSAELGETNICRAAYNKK